MRVLSGEYLWNVANAITNTRLEGEDMTNDVFEEIKLTRRLIEEHFWMLEAGHRQPDLHEG